MEPSPTRIHHLGKPEWRILVIEDDEITSTLVRHRLEREKMEVHHLNHGTEALELLRTSENSPPFDLVLLDVKLPGAGGYEILQEMRATEGWKEIPIIMFTGMGRDADVVRAFDLGADDYIQKPFSPTELMARVQRLLRSR